jgi:glyoxylase-like metal-dependent hydrolase (beta-lactamase superfamily II)
MASNGNPPGAPTRRAVIGGLAALTGGLAGATLGPSRGAAATSSAPVKVGEIELMVVSDGTLAAPRAFALPQTPPAEVEALYRAHGAEAPPQFVSQTNATLIRIGGELILVDAGSGPNFQATAGRLSQNLEAAGIDPETIAKVVFTHGHADHLWGALDDFEDAERFPNASYVIPAAEWDFWTDPDTPGRLPDWLKGMARGSARVLRKIEPKVERRRAGEAVAPGLTYLDTAGHTPGHMAVMAESRGERLLIGGDALNNPIVSFARPDWPFGSDLDRDAAASTRRTLLDRLAGDRIPLIGFHLPWPGIGRVARQGSGYRFELA